MIKSEYSIYDDAKKNIHNHEVNNYTTWPKKGNVVVTMQQDEPTTTWAITLLGFLPQLSGLAAGDECKDAIEQHLVNNPNSPVYGGTFEPRILQIK